MSDPKAKPRPQTLKTKSQPNSPVHTQPLAGVDASIERVNQLGRIARKLLGGKGSGGV
jgi:hypothetical protein